VLATERFSPLLTHGRRRLACTEACGGDQRLAPLSPAESWSKPELGTVEDPGMPITPTPLDELSLRRIHL